ncbi:tigger transposable element-derived protein 1-like [Anastrepha obliqua]|uniref:tigger transposable element-derived protein 1-like n=1 Tax=Anastrepha obliqua TaxID=95512 RepID=UPI0024096818|nr:tigger transposable element-derived protein 1-like [Anastrepha obliqua]
MLLIWLEDLNQKRIPTNGQLIKERALRLYEQLKNSDPTISSSDHNIAEFSASTGWLTGFLKRNAFHNVKITGEIASADDDEAKSFPKKFLKIIEDGGYSPDQVFNADETGLFWKKMPSRTYIAKSEKSASGFKAAKDRVTFLFCSNASGDRILKPLVINRSLKPRSLKGKDMAKLPVHWIANKKAWVTTAIFTEWFNRYFVPEVKKYLLDKGLEFKVILLIDNAPGHPHIEHANVEIVFLPPNTTSILQPLDQGIICNFKKHYLKFTFQHILDKIENEGITVTDAWKKFSILDCINHAGLAVKAIKPQTLNTCWKTVWPECNQSGSLSEEISISEIISLGHEIGAEGFETLCSADIDELLLDAELNDEDLMEIIAGDSGKDIESEDEITPFTSNVNRKGIQMCRELENYYLTNDPDTERALKFQPLKIPCFNAPENTDEGEVPNKKEKPKTQ